MTELPVYRVIRAVCEVIYTNYDYPCIYPECPCSTEGDHGAEADHVIAAKAAIAIALADNGATIRYLREHPALADYRFEDHQIIDVLAALRQLWAVEE